MRLFLLTGEVLVGGVLLSVAVVLGVVFTRRRLIARGKPLTVCALREPGDRRWRFGLARYGTSGLEWFTILGLSLRPARRWDRGLLNIRASRPLEPGERPEILIPAAVRVECRYRQARFELALARAPYTVLRSWLEASPPGRGVNVA
ncbi:MAG TPA: DUF2550 domain-containing protein [Dermatophilaceae bacterium]